MRLIYVLMNAQNDVLMRRLSTGYQALGPCREVDHSHGFEPPEPDNQWFRDHCGIEVRRKYFFADQDLCVCVFETDDGAEPMGGYGWVRFDEIPPLADGAAQRAVMAALRHHNESHSAPWVRPGGFAPYLDWAKGVAVDGGLSQVGRARQVRNTYVSSLFALPANDFELYMKIPSAIYVNGAEVERFWSGATYGVPHFLAVSPDGAASLTRDMGGTDAADGDVAAYRWIARDWGERQQHLTDANRGIKEQLALLHDYTPQTLLSSLDGFIARLRMLAACDSGALGGDQIDRAQARMGRIRDLLGMLCDFRLPNALCHGDIRPGNIRELDGRYALYDWGLSFYGHPFCDMSHFLHVVRRRLSAADRRDILTAYLQAWTGFRPMDELVSAFEITDELKLFMMTYQDCDWLLHIIEACGGLSPRGSMDAYLYDRRLHYFRSVFERFLSE